MKRGPIIIGTIAFVLLVIALGFIVWRLNLASEVNAKLRAIRDAGLPVNDAELNKFYPEIPDNQNAAVVMKQAFALLQEYPDERSNAVAQFKIPPFTNQLTIEQKKLLSGYVEMNASALSKMQEAIKLRESRYPVNYSNGMNTLFPHLNPLRHLAKAAELSGLLAMNENRFGDADDSIEDILGLARTLNQEPEFLSQIERSSLVRMATSVLEYRLNMAGLTDLELIRLNSDFSGWGKTNFLIRAEIGKRAEEIPYFHPSSGEDPGRVSDYSHLMLVRLSGVLDRDFLFYLNAMESQMTLMRMGGPENLVEARKLDKKLNDRLEHSHFLISKMFVAEISLAIAGENKNLAEADFVKIAIAIERFRLVLARLPINLNELVPQYLSAVPMDPFDGQPLRYHHVGNGYIIYSVGPDGHDNNGLERQAEWSDKTEYDIVFKVER